MYTKEKKKKNLLYWININGGTIKIEYAFSRVPHQLYFVKYNI